MRGEGHCNFNQIGRCINASSSCHYTDGDWNLHDLAMAKDLISSKVESTDLFMNRT